MSDHVGDREERQRTTLVAMVRQKMHRRDVLRRELRLLDTELETIRKELYEMPLPPPAPPEDQK